MIDAPDPGQPRVRPLAPQDGPAWLAMRAALNGSDPAELAPEVDAHCAGHGELASDALLDDAVSHAAHAALGFAEVERQVCFRRPLSPSGTAAPERGFRVRALGEIAIRCADLDAMTTFYRDLIGPPVLRGGHREGIVFFDLGESHGGHRAVLALFGAGTAPAAVPSSLHHLVLVVDAAEQQAAAGWLRRLGLPCRVENFDWIGWRGVFTADPEGNTVELVARAGPTR